MDNYEVAVDYPINPGVLTYSSVDVLSLGDVVTVPLGKRSAKGVVLTKLREEIDYEVRPVEGKSSRKQKLTELEIKLYQWMAKYYHYPLGKLIFDCLPKEMKRLKELDLETNFNPVELTLYPEQREVFLRIKDKLGCFSQHLLFGVTGSGKSAIYLKLMQEVLSEGKSVQILLPEINLTPQLTEFFRSHLSAPILTYHSAMTAGEKYAVFSQIGALDRPIVMLGVRSSLFAPVNNLGLMVVDEEHDSSFKQQDRCAYNARDVAIKKAQLYNVPIVLGSATPSLESYYRFQKENLKENFHKIETRAGSGEFPEIALIDARGKSEMRDPLFPLMEESLRQMKARLNQGEQVLVFLNKLGFSHYIQCRSCGHQFKNEQCGCDHNLRYFKKKNYLSCAFCDYKRPAPNVCPDCGSLSLINIGFGVEKVQEVLQDHLEGFHVDRFDRDEIKSFSDLKAKLDAFHSGAIDVLVGTQMLAKGHNFKKVNLVVILGADNMLNNPDFRASEKLMQLLEQVSGRAGRFGGDPKVLIQTMSPEHSLFHHLKERSLEEFYQDELKFRQMLRLSPFSSMATIGIHSRLRDLVVKRCQELHHTLIKLKSHFPDVDIRPPAPFPIEKKANQFSWMISLRSSDRNQLHGMLTNYRPDKDSRVSFTLDVDPN